MACLARAAPHVHLVLGDHAAATLRAAIARHGLPGDVNCIPDDLGHGPLHDGVARVDYMRRCFAGCAAWDHIEADAFAYWRSLRDELEARPRNLVVWRGRNVSETVLLAMACTWLRDSATPISVVDLPDQPNGSSHTGTHRPRDLAAVADRARPLPASEREQLSALFENLRSDNGVRRQWVGDTIVTVSPDTFDHLLWDACTPAWLLAARVVAAAMSKADPRDGLSDIFLCSRLQALIAAGRIEADRTPQRMRDYSVRRAPA